MKKLFFTLPSLLIAAASVAPVQAQDVKGDAAAGSHKNALCVGCHGIKGFHTAFPETYQVPKLSGQGAGYLSAALHAYKSGERKHPSMRTLASSLTGQDIADLAAYYESTGTGVTLAPRAAAGPAKVAELVVKGACASCHGENFSKPISPAYPRIAGQHSDYLFAALKAYKTEKPFVGRSNPIMGGVTKQFSNAELKVLADYMGSLPSELQTLQPVRFK
ncbi:MAG: c-type cytochrome [Rhodoferax sp.]